MVVLRGRQISDFEASLVSRASSRTVRSTQRNPVSKERKKKSKAGTACFNPSAREVKAEKVPEQVGPHSETPLSISNKTKVLERWPSSYDPRRPKFNSGTHMVPQDHQ